MWLEVKGLSMTTEGRVAKQVSWVEETIHLTTTAIEEIHKSIAEVPLEVMRRSGLFEKTADDVGELQERSISAVYGAVRDVNRRICGLASDLLDPVAPHSES
jgi:hypothetical protein